MQDKLIYTDPLGRQFDPLSVYRKLVIDSQAKINDHLSDWQSDDELLSAQAEEVLVKIARSTFGLRSFSEQGGHSDAQALDALTHYLEWAEKKGRGRDSKPTVQPCTDSPLLTPPTTPCSDCG